jgi:hypothetical protein
MSVVIDKSNDMQFKQTVALVCFTKIISDIGNSQIATLTTMPIMSFGKIISLMELPMIS